MTKFLHVRPIVLFLLISAASAQAKFFPSHAFEKDAKFNKFVDDWYSSQLRALHEPSLLAESRQASAQSYRFLWLRSFHHPIAVRLDVKPDGTGTLTTKVCSGAGGYAPGHLVTDISKLLTKQQTDSFLHKIDVNNFWNLPPVPDEPLGNDGAQWIIEGVKGGKYHIATYWSPSKGPIYNLGTTLAFDLAGLAIPKKEQY